MRDWIGDKEQASFDGIPFALDGESITSGRRVQTNEYVGTDAADHEDLGRKAPELSVQGYLVGDGADGNAEALFQRCSESGAGELVLPFRDQRQAICIEVTRSYRADTLGRFNVRMRFRLLDDKPLGIWVEGLGERRITDAARAAHLASAQDFTDVYSTAKAPDIAKETLADKIREQTQRLIKLRARVRAGVSGLTERYLSDVLDTADALAEAYRIADSFAEDIYVGLRSDLTARLPGEINILMTAMLADAPSSRTTSSAMADTIAEVRAEITEEPTFQSESHRSIHTLETALNKMLLAELSFAYAQAVIEIEYDTVTLAESALSVLHDVMYQAAIEAQSAASTDAITVLHGLVADHLYQTALHAPDTIKVTRAREIPAALAAWQIYADPSRSTELVVRNGVSDPLAMPTEFDALVR